MASLPSAVGSQTAARSRSIGMPSAAVGLGCFQDDTPMEHKQAAPGVEQPEPDHTKGARQTLSWATEEHRVASSYSGSVQVSRLACAGERGQFSGRQANGGFKSG